MSYFYKKRTQKRGYPLLLSLFLTKIAPTKGLPPSGVSPWLGLFPFRAPSTEDTSLLRRNTFGVYGPLHPPMVAGWGPYGWYTPTKEGCNSRKAPTQGGLGGGTPPSMGVRGRSPLHWGGMGGLAPPLNKKNTIRRGVWGDGVPPVHSFGVVHAFGMGKE